MNRCFSFLACIVLGLMNVGCTKADEYLVKKLESHPLLGKSIQAPDTFFFTKNAPQCNKVDYYTSANHKCHFSNDASHIIYANSSTVSHLATGTTVGFAKNKQLTVSEVYFVEESRKFLNEMPEYNVVVLVDQDNTKYEIHEFMIEHWLNFYAPDITPFQKVNQYCFLLEDYGIKNVEEFIYEFGLEKVKVEKRFCHFKKKEGAVLIFDDKEEYAIFTEHSRLIPGLIRGM